MTRKNRLPTEESFTLQFGDPEEHKTPAEEVMSSENLNVDDQFMWRNAAAYLEEGSVNEQGQIVENTKAPEVAADSSDADAATQENPEIQGKEVNGSGGSSTVSFPDGEPIHAADVGPEVAEETADGDAAATDETPPSHLNGALGLSAVASTKVNGDADHEVNGHADHVNKDVPIAEDAKTDSDFGESFGDEFEDDDDFDDFELLDERHAAMIRTPQDAVVMKGSNRFEDLDDPEDSDEILDEAIDEVPNGTSAADSTEDSLEPDPESILVASDAEVEHELAADPELRAEPGFAVFPRDVAESSDEEAVSDVEGAADADPEDLARVFIPPRRQKRPVLLYGTLGLGLSVLAVAFVGMVLQLGKPQVPSRSVEIAAVAETRPQPDNTPANTESTVLATTNPTSPTPTATTGDAEIALANTSAVTGDAEAAKSDEQLVSSGEVEAQLKVFRLAVGPFYDGNSRIEGFSADAALTTAEPVRVVTAIPDEVYRPAPTSSLPEADGNGPAIRFGSNDTEQVVVLSNDKIEIDLRNVPEEAEIPIEGLIATDFSTTIDPAVVAMAAPQLTVLQGAEEQSPEAERVAQAIYEGAVQLGLEIDSQAIAAIGFASSFAEDDSFSLEFAFDQAVLRTASAELPSFDVVTESQATFVVPRLINQPVASVLMVEVESETLVTSTNAWAELGSFDLNSSIENIVPAKFSDPLTPVPNLPVPFVDDSREILAAAARAREVEARKVERDASRAAAEAAAAIAEAARLEATIAEVQADAARVAAVGLVVSETTDALTAEQFTAASQRDEAQSEQVATASPVQAASPVQTADAASLIENVRQADEVDISNLPARSTEIIADAAKVETVTQPVKPTNEGLVTAGAAPLDVETDVVAPAPRAEVAAEAEEPVSTGDAEWIRTARWVPELGFDLKSVTQNGIPVLEIIDVTDSSVLPAWTKEGSTIITVNGVAAESKAVFLNAISENVKNPETGQLNAFLEIRVRENLDPRDARIEVPVWRTIVLGDGTVVSAKISKGKWVTQVVSSESDDASGLLADDILLRDFLTKSNMRAPLALEELFEAMTDSGETRVEFAIMRGGELSNGGVSLGN